MFRAATDYSSVVCCVQSAWRGCRWSMGSIGQRWSTASSHSCKLCTFRFLVIQQNTSLMHWMPRAVIRMWGSDHWAAPSVPSFSSQSPSLSSQSHPLPHSPHPFPHSPILFLTVPIPFLLIPFLTVHPFPQFCPFPHSPYPFPHSPYPFPHSPLSSSHAPPHSPPYATNFATHNEYMSVYMEFKWALDLRGHWHWYVDLKQ